jgi:hypothetical protein
MQPGENDPPPTVSRLPLLSAKARRLSKLHESPSDPDSFTRSTSMNTIQATFTAQPAVMPRQRKARFSLATGPDSPLATPPKRRLVDEIVQSERKLNAYGIPSLSSRRRASMRAGGERIRVCVRKKPAASDIVLVNGAGVTVNETKAKLDGIGRYNEEHKFQFDRVYDEDVGNHQVRLIAI